MTILHTDHAENSQTAVEFDGWTEDEAEEAEDKCSKMQAPLDEQFKRVIRNLTLNCTRLLPTWVSQQVVDDALQISTSAFGCQSGALIVSKQDRPTVLAHYAWGPGIFHFQASQVPFKQ